MHKHLLCKQVSNLLLITAAHKNSPANQENSSSTLPLDVRLNSSVSGPSRNEKGLSFFSQESSTLKLDTQSNSASAVNSQKMSPVLGDAIYDSSTNTEGSCIVKTSHLASDYETFSLQASDLCKQVTNLLLAELPIRTAQPTRKTLCPLYRWTSGFQAFLALLVTKIVCPPSASKGLPYPWTPSPIWHQLSTPRQGDQS